LLEGSSLTQTEDEEAPDIVEDQGSLRQDRYPLRTAPQFVGPAVEDMLSALKTITIECNSSTSATLLAKMSLNLPTATDNPLIDGKSGRVLHGGNFQAMAVTAATEKTRLGLYACGKLLFAQATELCNPSMNRGLPPNLAATDPPHDFFAKGKHRS
jgi:phenylalanine ammonia-lyase